MRLFRFLVMTAALLALATSGHAQSLSAASLQAAYTGAQHSSECCPLMNAPTWVTQYLQQGMATWKQVQAVCTGRTCDNGVCGSIVVSGPGCVKCCEAVQAPASCCCAKACTCCETCKTKKDATACVPVFPYPLTEIRGGDIEIHLTGQPMLPPVMPNADALKWIEAQQADRDRKIAEFYQRTGHPGSAAFYYELVQRRYAPMPPAPPMPAPRQIVQVQAVPAPPMLPPPAPGVRVVECLPTVSAVKHAHLVTPDLDAHCLRMTHCGDTIILEGDVILLSKKHAQPIRIEAQRVIVNMKDGSVTVEGASSVSNFGVMRTSAVAPVVERVQAEERRTQVIRLRNTPAADVAQAITAFLKAADQPVWGGYPNHKSLDLQRHISVVAEPISNSVLINVTPKYHGDTIRMITELDRPAAPLTVAPVTHRVISVPGQERIYIDDSPPIPRN